MVETLYEPWTQCITAVKRLSKERSREAQTTIDRALVPLRDIESEVASYSLAPVQLTFTPGSGHNRNSFDSVQTLVGTLIHRKALLRADTSQAFWDFDRELA